MIKEIAAPQTYENSLPRQNIQNSKRCESNHIAASCLNQSKNIGRNMQALVTTDELDFSVIEQVVMQGDLSKLNPRQRVHYYHKFCESAGLNPFTRPFDYILLNGKLTLYAKKECTEQLRKLNGISIEGIEGKVVDDLYIVKARARDRIGRTDESTGAVTIGHLKGDAKANAIMKAETKAKRRVTLSISGLGLVDETELETIPSAKNIQIDIETGTMVPITKDQASELSGILDQCDPEYKESVMSSLKDNFYAPTIEEIPLEIYERVKSACVKNMELFQSKKIKDQMQTVAEEMTEETPQEEQPRVRGISQPTAEMVYGRSGRLGS